MSRQNNNVATNNTVANVKEEMNMTNNTVSTNGNSVDSMTKINAYFNIISVEDIKKIAKEIGIIEVARLRNKEKIISIISRVVESKKETREFIERQAYRRALEVQANAIDSVKMGVANKEGLNEEPKWFTELKEFTEFKERQGKDTNIKEEKEMTATEKFMAMNPGLINTTINKEDENNPVKTIMELAEITKKVDTMTVEQRRELRKKQADAIDAVKKQTKMVDTMTKEQMKEIRRNKMVEIDTIKTGETKEDLICQLLLVEWCLQSSTEPYTAKDGKEYHLFFTTKDTKYEKGTYISMEGPAKKVAFSVFDTVYGKNWGTIGVYKLWEKMQEKGYCHIINGNYKARENGSLVIDSKTGETVWVQFVHMSTQERINAVLKYRKYEKMAKISGFTGNDAARQYILAKLGK